MEVRDKEFNKDRKKGKKDAKVDRVVVLEPPTVYFLDTTGDIPSAHSSTASSSCTEAYGSDSQGSNMVVLYPPSVIESRIARQQAYYVLKFAEAHYLPQFANGDVAADQPKVLREILESPDHQLWGELKFLVENIINVCHAVELRESADEEVKVTAKLVDNNAPQPPSVNWVLQLLVDLMDMDVILQIQSLSTFGAINATDPNPNPTLFFHPEVVSKLEKWDSTLQWVYDILDRQEMQMSSDHRQRYQRHKRIITRQLVDYGRKAAAMEGYGPLSISAATAADTPATVTVSTTAIRLIAAHINAAASTEYKCLIPFSPADSFANELESPNAMVAGYLDDEEALRSDVARALRMCRPDKLDQKAKLDLKNEDETFMYTCRTTFANIREICRVLQVTRLYNMSQVLHTDAHETLDNMIRDNAMSVMTTSPTIDTTKLVQRLRKQMKAWTTRYVRKVCQDAKNAHAVERRAISASLCELKEDTDALLELATKIICQHDRDKRGREQQEDIKLQYEADKTMQELLQEEEEKKEKEMKFKEKDKKKKKKKEKKKNMVKEKMKKIAKKKNEVASATSSGCTHPMGFNVIAPSSSDSRTDANTITATNNNTASSPAAAATEAIMTGDTDIIATGATDADTTVVGEEQHTTVTAVVVDADAAALCAIPVKPMTAVMSNDKVICAGTKRNSSGSSIGTAPYNYQRSSVCQDQVMPVEAAVEACMVHTNNVQVHQASEPMVPKPKEMVCNAQLVGCATTTATTAAAARATDAHFVLTKQCRAANLLRYYDTIRAFRCPLEELVHLTDATLQCVGLGPVACARLRMIASCNNTFGSSSNSSSSISSSSSSGISSSCSKSSGSGSSSCSCSGSGNGSGGGSGSGSGSGSGNGSGSGAIPVEQTTPLETLNSASLPSMPTPFSAHCKTGPVDNTESCVICFSATPSTVCLPCSHRILCTSCASDDGVIGTLKECPICRKNIHCWSVYC